MKTLLELCKEKGLTNKQINNFYKIKERQSKINNRYTLKEYIKKINK
jgi:hypothetical protein